LPQDAFVVLVSGEVTPSCRARIAALPAHVLALSDVSHDEAQDACSRVKLVGACCAAADVLVVQGDQCDDELEIGPKQAMACGLPVLAMAQRSADDISRIVEDGVTGYVLYSANPEVLIDHLRYLRDQPHWRSAMGMAAILRARTLFTWTRAADRLLDIYGDCAQANQLTHVGQICRSLTLIQPRPSHQALTISPPFG
jgi:glycosyltransferase involved in cell wall biosynthesis